MKKFLKSAGLPIGVFALAIGSAFATNAMKNVQLNSTDRIGHYELDSDNEFSCVQTNITCSTISDGPICTWYDAVNNQERTLYEKDELTMQCPTVLYQKQP
ncbi:DUF6520 family protein [Myroides odoratimimus]|uniref:DUF6520 family protein n=1 Tax=Myroides odoratimimus TaxID=76832 RepID=UPI002577D47A|nr:DUF6520 family protein [Myroides odoratimimus]MDM1519401.1 hypothetical protein [Myroides odoratimimus]